MSEAAAKVWNACGYVRLSREDGDKEESNSVTGQKDLIRDFLRHHPELRECGMKVDDGYTGSNFNRPAFQEMLSDIKAGKFNCIVVKDLSRFGREYLDSGEYIERIFPFLGVRFIAINDNYDSLHREGSDDLIIPFKNLINEAYCRDTSVKIRSQLEIKRQRGDFIGPFAAFGYQKDPDEHHKLVIDEYAANVVRDIFKWKLRGISSCDIADRLTRSGIPTPMEHKRQQGMQYQTSFRVKAESEWSANMVLRILKNPIYIGTLEQGRVTTPSYKIKRLIHKPREEWAVVEGCHEPIIESDIFEIVQKVLALDTRTSPGGEGVELFSGLMYCGECGSAMIRKTVPSGKKKYVYYVCSAHKKQPAVCYSHNLRDVLLNEIVLDALKKHIKDVLGLAGLMEITSTAQLQQASVKKLQERLELKQGEISRNQTLLMSLYENLNDGIIDRAEYLDLKKTYTRRREEAEQQADDIRAEMEREINHSSNGHQWIDRFRSYQNITELDRTIVVSLIERILVYRDRRVEIVYRWYDEYQWYLDLLLKAQEMPPEREAM